MAAEQFSIDPRLQQTIKFDEDGASLLCSIVLDLSSVNSSCGRNTIVSICGGSCTGKSTQVSRVLENAIGSDAQVLSQDNYMFSSVDSVADSVYRWDHPVLYGLPESLQVMDHLRHDRACYMPVQSVQHQTAQVVKVTPSKIILFEGLYTGLDTLADAADLIIYVEMPLYARIVRRLIRNMYERYRNLSPQLILESFLKSPLAAHRDFVINQKLHADVVVTMIYRFSDTVTRFNLTSVAEPRVLRNYTEQYRFVVAGDLTFEICKYASLYDFAIIHQDRTYLRFEVNEDIFFTLLTLDFQSV